MSILGMCLENMRIKQEKQQSSKILDWLTENLTSQPQPLTAALWEGFKRVTGCDDMEMSVNLDKLEHKGADTLISLNSVGRG